MPEYILIFGWGPGNKMAEDRRQNKRHGDGLVGPGGHSANLKAWMSFLRGSWRLCTPSLVLVAALPTGEILSHILEIWGISNPLGNGELIENWGISGELKTC